MVMKAGEYGAMGDSHEHSGPVRATTTRLSECQRVAALRMSRMMSVRGGKMGVRNETSHGKVCPP